MEYQIHDEEIITISKLMKSMSHPIRFKILCLLKEQEISVGDLRDQLATTNSNITQHLNILRSLGVIDYRKDANFIYNRIIDDRIIKLMDKMHQLFLAGTHGNS